MSNKTKKPLFASGLYIALSFCILAVVGIGVYSAIGQMLTQEKRPVVQTPPTFDLETPTTAPNEEMVEEVPILAPLPENQTQDDTTENQTQEPQAPETSNEHERIYMSPVTSDNIIKEFTVEELAYSATMNDYRTHTGIDIACEIGSPVCAFTDGVVESIHADPMMGQTVVLNHGGGLKSVYQNLALEIPEGILAGVEVHAGDLIACVGDTALIECAEEPHLHFEVVESEAHVDPLKFLNP